jgi:hypothetical protein
MAKMFCTDDYRIFSVTTKLNSYYRNWKPQLPEPNPDFRTPLLEKRLSAVGLSLPDHELVFSPRVGIHYLNVEKLIGTSHLLNVSQGVGVLAVPATDIEDKPLYVSKNIEQMLSVQPVK